MGLAIPFAVYLCVIDAKIGREIDDLYMVRQLADHSLRRGMRQSAKHQIGSRHVNLVDFFQIR